MCKKCTNSKQYIALLSQTVSRLATVFCFAWCFRWFYRQQDEQAKSALVFVCQTRANRQVSQQNW